MRYADAISDADLAEIASELDVDHGGDGVWIDPAYVKKYDITAAQEASLEQAVADADTDVTVVLADIALDDPRISNGAALAAWIEDDISTGGTYVVTMGDYDGHRIEVSTYSRSVDDLWVSVVANDEHPDDPVAQALYAIELLDTGRAEEIHQAQLAESRDEGGVPEGWLIGGVALLVLGGLALAVRWVMRRGRAAAPAPLANEPRFRLPERVLRTVREAEDRQVRQRADREVLALGEALDAAEISDRAPATLDAWQAALDHYAAARRVLEEAGSPADVMGALVLAQRGSSALQTARRPGTQWAPTPTCYFHPLHEGKTTRVSWTGEGVAVTVPACGACATSLAAGDEPADVLDFVEGKTPVHYFALDIAPWSTAGYGSLEPDLLAALLRTSVAAPESGE